MSEKENKIEDKDGRPGQVTPAGGDGTPHLASTERHGKGVSIWAVAAILISVVAVGYIIMDGADDAVFAYTVDQAAEQQTALVGKNFKVRGTVVKGSLKAKPGTLNSKFDLSASGKVITVTFDKALPDTFEEGREVIAEGTLASNGELVADQVIAKCPSKYEEAPPTAKSDKMGGAGSPEM